VRSINPEFSEGVWQVFRDAEAYNYRSVTLSLKYSLRKNTHDSSQFWSFNRLSLPIMTANFQPHGLITDPGLQKRYEQAVSEPYEAHARGLTGLLLSNLIDDQKQKGRRGLYSSENTPVNDDTRTEADNVVWFNEHATFELLILCIAEGKMDKSKGKHGRYQWSILASGEAEKQVLSYCKEYMLHKDKNKYPFIYAMSYQNTM
jgi:hypothetical protein